MRPAPDDRYVVALASLPTAGPVRLRALLERYGPEGAWAAVLDGEIDPVVFRSGVRTDPGAVVARWARHARTVDPDAYWSAHVEAGIGVATSTSPAFPLAFAQDDDPPPVVFWKGDADHLAGMRVGIVGTRDATRYGIDLAHSMGRELAEHGVAVVSGLALGIDGAAHAGALAAADGAAPIGVVGSGLDRVYPRDHGGLWRAVADRGVLFSEYPLGTPAAAWRFPARNRLIAALADVVVVVESHATGGAMGTAVEADRRGRTVLAVPGPVTARSSDGTNQLLFEGRGPARDTADVLLALGVAGVTRRSAEETRPRPTGVAAEVLGAMPWQPVALEQLVLLTGLDVGGVALALDDLERDGWVARRSGWAERVGREPRGGPR